MKKWIKWLGIGVAALALTIVVGGMLLSGEWEVQRSIVIDAEPAQIHPHIAELKKWEAWSPFEKEDPTMTISYDGPASGVGASRSWISPKMGNGTQKVIRDDPEWGVKFELTFEDFDPLFGEFTYAKVDGGTEVTWRDWGAMSGIAGGWMALMMEPMMGDAFESGLADLKTTVEAKK